MFLYGNRYQDGETDQVTISNFMITKVNDNTWEQYGAMPSTEFESPIQNVTGNANATICNKNFIKNITNGFFDNKTKELSRTDSLIYKSFSIFLKKGTYVLSCNTKINIIRAFTDYDNSEYVIFQNGTNVNQYVINITKDTILYVSVRRNDSANWLDTDLLQLEEGETSTNYAEHQEQTFTFPLAEGQRLMKGDYLADDGIHHKRGQVVLTGNETGWNYNSAQNAFWIKNTEISNCKNEAHAKLCNYFPYSSSSFNVAEINTLCENSNSTNLMFTFKVDTSVASDLTKWKAFLSERYANGKPVIVEYDLAEEEIEAYTPEQQVVHNEIKKTAHSYGEQTHIFCTDETSLIFDVEAKADIQAMFNNLQAQILAGEV